MASMHMQGPPLTGRDARLVWFKLLVLLVTVPKGRGAYTLLGSRLPLV